MSNTFEVHTQSGGRWRIDSVFDDRELAIENAKQAAKKPTVEAVRVVVEVWDERTQRGATRTVYRSSRQQEAINADIDRAKHRAAEERIEKRAASLLASSDRVQVMDKRRRSSRNWFVAKMAVRIAVVLAVSAGGVYLLRMLSNGKALF